MTAAPLPPLPEPFFADGEHIGIVIGGARALFTTRRGGRSRGPYASLNLGRFTDDEPAAVEANREAVERLVGRRLVYGRQVHGARVQRRSAAGEVGGEPVGAGGGPGETGEPVKADGQATAARDLAPLVLTADCLPVAIAGEGAVAMIHAGWRGLSAGVIAAGVRAVRELGARGALQAAIGPGAGPCCYEVGEEVLAAFAGDREHVHGRLLDLKGLARERLREAGVQLVHDVGLCTICSEEGLFFSHRRDRGLTGRQAGIAWLR
jgi:YfiH family protein